MMPPVLIVPPPSEETGENEADDIIEEPMTQRRFLSMEVPVIDIADEDEEEGEKPMRSARFLCCIK